MMLFNACTNGSPVEIFPAAPSKANQYDVVCGRGREAFNNDGNKRLRRIVGDQLAAYSNAASKIEKSSVVTSIIERVRSAGEFVKKDERTGCFEKVSERVAREKVGQAFRDALHTTYKSSTMAKKRRRVAEQQYQDNIISNIVNSNGGVRGVVRNVEQTMKRESHSDAKVSDMLLAANMQILKELKDSSCAEHFSKACNLFQDTSLCDFDSDSDCY